MPIQLHRCEEFNAMRAKGILPEGDMGALLVTLVRNPASAEMNDSERKKIREFTEDCAVMIDLLDEAYPKNVRDKGPLLTLMLPSSLFDRQNEKPYSIFARRGLAYHRASVEIAMLVNYWDKSLCDDGRLNSFLLKLQKDVIRRAQNMRHFCLNMKQDSTAHTDHKALYLRRSKASDWRKATCDGIIKPFPN
jgi:hypothetical protein